jgi:hypothetical protein
MDPEEVGRQALAEYDTNHDGYLDAKELEGCPALKSCLAALDKDKDGRLSAAEIAGRVAFYQESRIGLVAFNCRVLLNGSPLRGATMTLLPEKFLGPGFRPASGVSDERGHVEVRTEGEELPGVPCGLYRVQVSKQGPRGETVPPRYNTQTILGVEIAPDGPAGVVYRLTSG